MEVGEMKRRFALTLSLIVFFVNLGFSQLAGIPREETLIVNSLTGRVGSPANFNVFVSVWRNPDRGIQQLMLEPLWMIEPSRGEVFNSLAAEGPIYNDDFTRM